MPLRFENKKPTNAELAKHKGYKNESSFRAFANANPEEADKIILEYKAENYPFLQIEDYAKFYYPDETLEVVVKDLKEKILNNEIPGTIYTDGNNNKNIYLPAIYPHVDEILKELDSIKKTKVICIGNYKGGVGKTTNLCNIAATLAYLGKKVLLIDNDVQGNCTTSFGYIREDFENTLVELITKVNDSDIEEVLRKSIVSIDTEDYFENRIIGKIDLIPNSPVVMELAEDLPTYSRNLGTMENTLKKLISHIKDDYDYILIDLPPAVNLFLRMSIMASDYFVFSLTPETFSRDGIPSIIRPVIKQAKIYKEEIGKEYKILGAINSMYETGRVQNNTDNLNKEDNNIGNSNFENFDKYGFKSREQQINTENSNEKLIELLGEDYTLFDTFIPKNKIFDSAQLSAKSAAIFEAPTDKGVRSFFDLTKDIVTRMYIEELKN
jgi:chromosome partitioning protein